MAPDEPSGARPSPVVLRIKLRYDDLEAMVQRFAANVGRSGIFLPTKSIQPIDSEVKFELRLANDTPALVGLGRVRATRAPDPANARIASGMTVELMRVTRDSRDLILRMLERRRELGLPDVALPMPADVDAARRPDSEPAAVKQAVPQAAPVEVISGPVSSPSDSLLTAPRSMGATREYGIKPLAPEPVKRPRPRISELIAKSAGAVAATPAVDENAEVDVASALARARALATGDLDKELESLTKDNGATPSEISIEAASAELAKQLGGNAVRRDRSARWAPPPAGAVADGTSETLTVAAAAAAAASGPDAAVVAPEAAATEVSSSTEPPPQLTIDVPAPISVPVAVPEKGRTQPLPRIKPLAPLSSIVPLPAIAPLPAEPRFLVDTKPEPALAAESSEVAEWDAAGPTNASTEPPGALADAQPKARSRTETAKSRPETPNPTYLRASTADIAEAIAAIDNVADSLVTGTQTIAEDAVEAPQLRPSSSSMDAAIEDAIDAAMLHTPPPDDGDPGDGVEFRPLHLRADELDAASSGPAIEITPLPHEIVHQLSELDMEDVENTNVGGAPDVDGGYGHDLAEQLERHLADAEAESEAELQAAIHEASGAAQPIDDLDEFEIEEVSDFEIIAEADAEDADLLLADGERDASQDAADPYAAEPPLRPSQDFASRLDFGDDDFEDNRPPHLVRPETPVTVTPSAGYALSAYDDRIPEDRAVFEDEPLDFDRPSERYRYPNRAYNYADRVPSELDSNTADPPPAEEFDEPHAGFGQPRYESSPAEAQEPSRDVDLERTLSALDVDLDDLALPHARPLTPSPPSGPVRTRTPSGPVEPVRTKQPTPQAQRTKQPTPQAQRTKQPTPAQPVPEPAPVSGSGRIHRRASTEDGILIDFDDDAANDD